MAALLKTQLDLLEIIIVLKPVQIKHSCEVEIRCDWINSFETGLFVHLL